MATGQKKTTNQRRKRTTSSSKGKGKRGGTVHKATNDKNSIYRDEIVLMVTLVFSILLILSNFNLSGIVGQYIKDFTFGMIGFLAYLLPFLLFFGVAFSMANKSNKNALYKILNISALGVVLSAFIHLITLGYTGETSLIDIYKTSAEHRNGGGILGGIILSILRPLFGQVGTYVILLALLGVLSMFLTGKALFRTLGAKSEASLKQLKEIRRMREEEYEATSEREEEEVTEKRKARTILFSKKDKTSEALTKSMKQKSKEKTAQSGNFNDQSINMQEIKAETTEDIPIYRGNTLLSEDENNKLTYEEQIRQKFGRNETKVDYQPKAPSEEINSIQPDHDLNRLINAAMNDANLQGEVADVVLDSFDSFDISEPIIDDTTDVLLSEKAVQSNKKPVSNSMEKKETESLEFNISSKQQEKKEHVFPPLNLLGKAKGDFKGMSDKDLKETALKLQKTLESFGVRVTITNVSCGPSVTRYELQPEQGVKVSKITGLADDIKLNLAAADVRIEAPIPGKAAVGIEVPNKENATVLFRELLESKEFVSHPSNIAFAVGKDIGGQTIVTDIGKMPHLLIAGATGSGKSVCINTLIMSILYKANPNDVKMIMVDPKVVELSVYNGIPHLLIPVVTDPKKASAALNWAVMEMTERYKKFADLGVRDVKGYNEKVTTVEEYQDERYQKLPQIVIIVDELADLMMVAPGEVEDAICRLAQMARAAGLHLIIATQRPSVNVITGLIKANIPSRIAFSVSSAIDSRTIIDGSGAEKLLGKGDMLFFPSGYPKPVRVQGAFITDKEVSSVVEFLTNQNQGAEYNEDVVNKITSVQSVESTATSSGNDRDEYFAEAGKFIIEKDKASIGMLQRVYKIGFNRAARIMDQLSEAGVVGPEEGTKPRKVLMSLEEFEQYIDEYV
ncbi:MAG: cell division FtsK/SpoIIIE [Anaerocolumna sp.]|nr:cell division FtsK/SpoIIIE [Anaerocolumna sp.]